MKEGGKSTRTLLFEEHYTTKVVDGREIHPHESRILPELESWHPRPTTLNLEFSHTGEWVRVPRNQNQKGGPDYHSYRVGRLEKYIDNRGVTRSAVAYGMIIINCMMPSLPVSYLKNPPG